MIGRAELQQQDSRLRPFHPPPPCSSLSDGGGPDSKTPNERTQRHGFRTDTPPTPTADRTASNPLGHHAPLGRGRKPAKPGPQWWGSGGYLLPQPPHRVTTHSPVEPESRWAELHGQRKKVRVVPPRCQGWERGGEGRKG